MHTPWVRHLEDFAVKETGSGSRCQARLFVRKRARGGEQQSRYPTGSKNRVQAVRASRLSLSRNQISSLSSWGNTIAPTRRCDSTKGGGTDCGDAVTGPSRAHYIAVYRQLYFEGIRLWTRTAADVDHQLADHSDRREQPEGVQ